jgi:hypothetical protein
MPFKIETEPGATPVNRPIYRLSPSELEELRTTLDDLLAKGFICPSTSPWGAPVLFAPKKDEACAFVLIIEDKINKLLKMLTHYHVQMI